MASDQTTNRLFEKLDELKDDLHDVSERLARVEENQQSHYKDNDNQHNQMVSNIAEMKTEVHEVAERIDEVESALDKRSGEHKVFGGIWHLVITLIAGGGLVTIGGIIAKLIGIF